MIAAQERPQCPIGLVPFEAEGPNRPFALTCGHNISEEQLRLFLSKHDRLECPLCNHPLASQNIADYKPNYGMMDMLQLMETSVVLPSVPSASPSSFSPYTDDNANQTPQHEALPGLHRPTPLNATLPGSLADWQPEIDAGPSSDTQAADSSELEALPPAGSLELVELWPRVMRRYWINAAEALGNRDSWEPWGVDSDGSTVYSTVLAPQGMRVAVLEVKLPPFATLEGTPEVQLRLLRLARYNALARLRPHCIQFLGLGQSPACQNVDDSTGSAAGLSIYELPWSCLAEHLAFFLDQKLSDATTMALARMIASALAEAENSYLAGAAPGLFSIMVCPSTQTGEQLAPDFRLAPFCRGGHLQGRLISNWDPPANLSTLQALCTSREEVEGTAGINVFSSYVWRLAAVVVVANLGLEWFATWQVEDVFAKIMEGEHPNVHATSLAAPVKALLKDCLHPDPGERPSAEAVHTTLLMLLANDDTDAPVAAACSSPIVVRPPEPAPQPAYTPPVSAAPAQISAPHKATQNCGCLVM